MKVGFKDGFQHQLHGSLHHAIFDRRDPQWPGASLGFWDVHPPHRLKAVGLGSQLILQSAEHQPFFSTRHDACDGLAIHARRAPVCFHLFPGFPEHVAAPHLVVQTVKLHSVRLLGCAI